MPSWLSAVLAVVVSVSLGAFLNWLIGRKKEKRDDSSEERSDEQQLIDGLRNQAKDALEREKYAYERLAGIERENLSMREEKRALEVEYDIAAKKAEHADALEAEVSRLKRANVALDNDLKRILRENGHGSAS